MRVAVPISALPAAQTNHRSKRGERGGGLHWFPCGS